MGNTLVIDVTNFSRKADFQGSRENLHLVERWTLHQPDYARLRGHNRRPERLDTAMDRQAGVHEAER